MNVEYMLLCFKGQYDISESVEVVLGDGDKIKYHDISDQIPSYQ